MAKSSAPRVFPVPPPVLRDCGLTYSTKRSTDLWRGTREVPMQRRTRAFLMATAVVCVLGTRPPGVAAHEGGRRHGQSDTTGPDECLVGIHDSTGALSPGETLCQTASGHICTFSLQLCLNQGGCTPADFGARTVRASGHCGPVGQLRVQGAGTGSVCGAFTGVHVHT